MLSQVQVLQARTVAEIDAMKARALEPPEADHLMVESIRANALPASLLPKVLEAWERPWQPELFGGRNAWSSSTPSPRCSRPAARGSRWRIRSG